MIPPGAAAGAIRRSSPNRDARPAGTAIDMLVLHYTGMASAEAALARLCDPAARVSAHYAIDEDGTVYALIDEGLRAWHAGVAAWGGRADVNARSIGIELVNPGHEFGYRAFADAQMAALERLAVAILARHPIPPRNVVGHSDVAPRRKQDPGELFDWARLARAGVGLWPFADPGTPASVAAAGLGADPAETLALLAAYGYETADASATITAFQRHFRPARVDGQADGETAARARALLRVSASARA